MGELSWIVAWLKKALGGVCPKCGTAVEKASPNEPPAAGNTTYTVWGCGACYFEFVYTNEDEERARADAPLRQSRQG